MTMVLTLNTETKNSIGCVFEQEEREETEKQKNPFSVPSVLSCSSSVTSV
jgi:hypothetical protein